MEVTMWNSKPKKRDCDCRGRTHGNPKWGHGPCFHGMRKAVAMRIAGKRRVREWLKAVRAHADIDD